MQEPQEEMFQIATIVAIVGTVLVCICYALIFMNPQTPLNPFRPPTPVPSAAALLPPTWTPTSTFTPTPTNTPTLTPTPTNTPTFTPTSTNTPPHTATPTRPPRTNTPKPPPATATPPYAFRLGRSIEMVDNCGTWYLSGTIWNSSDPNQGVKPGVPVRVVFGNTIQGTDISGSHSGKSAGYWEWIFAKGTSGNGYVQIVDSGGNALSPQIPFYLTASCTPGQGVNQITIDFVGTR